MHTCAIRYGREFGECVALHCITHGCVGYSMWDVGSNDLICRIIWEENALVASSVLFYLPSTLHVRARVCERCCWRCWRCFRLLLLLLLVYTRLECEPNENIDDEMVISAPIPQRYRNGCDGFDFMCLIWIWCEHFICARMCDDDIECARVHFEYDCAHGDVDDDDGGGDDDNNKCSVPISIPKKAERQ